MDQFSYITGFFGVLIGITLTELVKGVADTLRNRKRIKYFLPHGVLVIAVFVFIVQSFFDFQNLTAGIAQWSPLLVIRFTLPWVLLCLAAYLIFPSFEGDQIVNFKAHFDEFTTGTLKVFTLVFPLVIGFNIFAQRRDIFDAENWVMLIAMAFTILALSCKREWLKVALVCGGTGYILFHVIMY